MDEESSLFGEGIESWGRWKPGVKPLDEAHFGEMNLKFSRVNRGLPL